MNSPENWKESIKNRYATIKNWKESVKNEKIRAVFSKMSPLEFFLMFLPFSLSYITLFGGFIFIIIFFMMILSIFFLLGVRWRIFYLGFLIYIGILMCIKIGSPDQFLLGADRDSAIRVGIEAILNGKNPFKARTHLGHYPTPLPFTYLFYLPVYLLINKHTAYMNLIMLVAFSIALFFKYINTKRAHLILPVVASIMGANFYFFELLMQSDLVNSMIFLCMIILLLPDEIPEQKVFKRFKYITIVPEKPRSIDKTIVLFAILFGCILAMRIHFWLIVGIIPLYVLRIYGTKRTALLSAITIIVFLIIVLPFALMDLDFFLNVSPIAHNSVKFALWRNFKPFDWFSYIAFTFVTTFFTFGKMNGIVISCLILSISLLFGLVKCKNTFHLMMIISSCFLALLFFYFFGLFYGIIRDYISMAMICVIFTMFHVNLEKNEREIENKNDF